MQNMILVSDFDGTITQKDSLYHFFEEYALPEWTVVEKLWTEGKISSKECLIKEFELVPNLSENLIENFVKNLELDPYFKDFNNLRIKNGYDFIIVSDGLDYFINRILKTHGIDNINVITNHAEFINGKFTITFPNENLRCVNDSGTCKCKVVKSLKEKYEKICYIGDGVSDYCVADKADILYAKKSLLKYCREKEINYVEYNNYKDILPFISKTD